MAVLSTLPDTNRGVFSMKISADSSRVVFVADRDVNDVNDVNELYSVPITGGATVLLSPATVGLASARSKSARTALTWPFWLTR